MQDSDYLEAARVPAVRSEIIVTAFDETNHYGSATFCKMNSNVSKTPTSDRGESERIEGRTKVHGAFDRRSSFGELFPIEYPSGDTQHCKNISMITPAKYIVTTNLRKQ